ncbi:MAG: hypothetical protein RL456_3532 [Pseudomonadota bacterium]|jgi:hypothetical protein
MSGPRLLVVVGDIPWPARSGGRVDVWRRLQALSAAGYRLALLCWYDHGRVETPDDHVREALGTVCEAVRWYPIRRSPAEIVRRALHLGRLPSHVASRRVTAPMGELAAWVRAFGPQAVLLDGLYGVAVARPLAAAAGVPLLYRSHNIEHQYQAGQCARERRPVRRLGLQANLIGLERVESELMRQADWVLDISCDDLAHWRARGVSRISWLPTSVDAGFLGALRRGPPAGDPGCDLLYFGNLHTPNNLEALRWLVDEVLARVDDPGLRVRVAGSAPTAEARACVARDPRIELRPDPADMAAEIAAARMLVNPMRSGSGVNLKSVEMLFTDAELLSSPVGVGGLSPEARACFRVEDGAQGWIEALRARGTARPDLAARALARAAYAPQAGVREIDAVLRRLGVRPSAGVREA